jgi:hypothetical protein
MDAHMTGTMTKEARSAHCVLEIGNWFLWNWDDPPADSWHLPFGMFHSCGVENERANPIGGVVSKYRAHGVKKLSDVGYLCERCAKAPPAGIVVAYEFMNWSANEYGG